MAKLKRNTEVIARAAIFHGSKILLCQNRALGYFYLPGGHVEFGERAEEAVLRELAEEAGVEGIVVGLCAVSENAFIVNRKHHHELNLVFHVELQPATKWKRNIHPPIVLSREPEIDFSWIEIASIPETDLRPRELAAWLASGGAESANRRPVDVSWISQSNWPETPALA